MGTAPLTPAAFRDATGVSRETLERLKGYLRLLEKWQARINLVGAATLRDPWRRHFLDSAQLAPLVPADARVLVDLGSGSGFPGLVLAMITGRPFHLVESDQRKAVFLREVVRECNVPATVHAARIETLPPFEADVITARALASVPKMLHLGGPHLGKYGILLLLKGKSVDRELTESQKNWKLKFDIFESQTDPSGRLLRVREVSRRNDRRNST